MKVYRNRWYILDNSIIGIIMYHIPPKVYEELQKTPCSYLDSSIVRSAMYPNDRMPEIEIKIKGPEYLNYFQLLRGAEFTIEQAAVWWAKKGNKRMKIEPGLTGVVSGAFLEDVPDRKLSFLHAPLHLLDYPALKRIIQYTNQGFKLDPLELERIW